MELVNLYPRFRTMRLEDGELVVMLRGARRKFTDGWMSDQPHAGDWSRVLSYALIPATRPGARARAVLGFDRNLSVNPTDDAVLVTGPHDAVGKLLSEGPSFCRAKIRRLPQPQTAAQVAALALHRFLPATQEAPGSPGSSADLGTVSGIGRCRFDPS